MQQQQHRACCRIELHRAAAGAMLLDSRASGPCVCEDRGSVSLLHPCIFIS